MFYFFSKIFYQLLSPFYWILILLLLRYFSKSLKVKKYLLIAAILITIVFTNEFIFTFFAEKYQPAAVTIPDTKQYECGILLGGMTCFDKNDDGFFSESADRFLQTVKLYHQKKIKKILITGGSGNLFKKEKSEALFIEPELIKSGVLPADILIESKSVNTYENAIFSKQLLSDSLVKPPYLLITSALHMPRSQKIFNHAGMEVDIYPCNYIAIHEKMNISFLLTPKVETMYKWQFLIKEWVGTIVYKLTGKA